MCQGAAGHTRIFSHHSCDNGGAEGERVDLYVGEQISADEYAEELLNDTDGETELREIEAALDAIAHRHREVEERDSTDHPMAAAAS